MQEYGLPHDHSPRHPRETNPRGQYPAQTAGHWQYAGQPLRPNQTLPQQTRQTGLQVVYQQTRTINRVFVDYNRDVSYGLGSVLIAVSALCIVCNGVGWATDRNCQLRHNIYNVGYGWWCTFPTLVAGILALFAGRHKTGPLIRSSLAMAICSILLGIILFGTAVGITAHDDPPRDSCQRRSRTLGILLILGSLVDLGCSVWLAILCDQHLVCCCADRVVPEQHRPVYDMNQARSHQMAALVNPQQMTIRPMAGNSDGSGAMFSTTTEPARYFQVANHPNASTYPPNY